MLILEGNSNRKNSFSPTTDNDRHHFKTRLRRHSHLQSQTLCPRRSALGTNDMTAVTMGPRRTHTKSRTGCQSCKSRKVKVGILSLPCVVSKPANVEPGTNESAMRPSQNVKIAFAMGSNVLLTLRQLQPVQPVQPVPPAPRLRPFKLALAPLLARPLG